MAAIHINDQDTENLVRRLAAKRGKGIREAIHYAAAHALGEEATLDKTITDPSTMTDEELTKELDKELRDTTLEYTRLVAEHKGKKRGGSRVYQMISVHGPVGTLERLVDRPTEGLEFLQKIDRIDLAAEMIALNPRYERLISEDTRTRARLNLNKIGAR